MNPGVGNATGRGKKPHALPNMVKRYFVRHFKIAKVAAAPEDHNSQTPSLFKQKGVRAKSSPSNGCAYAVSRFSN